MISAICPLPPAVSCWSAFCAPVRSKLETTRSSAQWGPASRRSSCCLQERKRERAAVDAATRAGLAALLAFVGAGTNVRARSVRAQRATPESPRWGRVRGAAFSTPRPGAHPLSAVAARRSGLARGASRPRVAAVARDCGWRRRVSATGQSRRWESWNVRIWVVPEAALVRRGPYRFLQHPNYLAIAIELMAAPMIFGAWRTAILVSLLNLAALRVRIRPRRSTHAKPARSPGARPRFHRMLVGVSIDPYTRSRPWPARMASSTCAW